MYSISQPLNLVLHTLSVDVFRENLITGVITVLTLILFVLQSQTDNGQSSENNPQNEKSTNTAPERNVSANNFVDLI
jgi:hypothetical protein